jgi:hypothetical protein
MVENTGCRPFADKGDARQLREENMSNEEVKQLVAALDRVSQALGAYCIVVSNTIALSEIH